MNNSAVRGLVKAVIILGFIFIALYIFSYSKWSNRNFDDIDITYGGTQQQEQKDEKQKVKADYKDLYGKINYEFLEYNLGYEFFDIYYNNKEFTDEYYLFVGIINLIKNDMLVNCKINMELNRLDIDNKIKELFGNIQYNNKSFKTNDGALSFEYDENSQKYLIKTNKCSGFDYSSGGIKNIYVESVIEDEYLYIYEKSLFLDYTKDSFGNIIFNYHEGLDKNSKVVSNSLENIDLKSIKTHIYKFINKDGKYTLISID